MPQAGSERIKLWPTVFQNFREGKRRYQSTLSARDCNHLDLVLASNNEALVRMIEQFFSEIINRAVQERPKAEVVPIKREALTNDE